MQFPIDPYNLSYLIFTLSIAHSIKFDVKFKVAYSIYWLILEISSINFLREFEFQVGKFIFTLIAFISFVLVFLLIKLVYKILILNQSENPYTRKISFRGREFLVQMGVFSLPHKRHPSYSTLGLFRLSKDGTIPEIQYSQNMRKEIYNIVQFLERNPYLKILLIKTKSLSSLYPSFALIAYTIQEIHEEMQKEVSSNFLSLEYLHMKDPRFNRARLRDISYFKFRKIFKFNVIDSDISIDLVNFYNNFSLPTFELGLHELDILNQVIEFQNNSSIEFSNLMGQYYLGRDINNNPIYLDNPQNLIYYGSKRNFPTILKFQFLKNPVLVTDDYDLMKDIKEVYKKQVEIVSIKDLQVDLIQHSINHPKFLRILLQLWEQIIPRSVKSSYRSNEVSSSICEFLELYHLFKEPNDKINLIDLMHEQTYREFNKDISIDVFTKFKGIFDLSFLNKITTSVQETQDQARAVKDECRKFKDFICDFESNSDIKLKVISVEGLNKRQKLAILILFMVFKDQAEFRDNWLLFSLNDEDLDIETHLTDISKKIIFHEFGLHLTKINYLSSWIHDFSLHLCDSNIRDSTLRKYIYPNYPVLENGIMLNHAHTDKTILIPCLEI